MKSIWARAMGKAASKALTAVPFENKTKLLAKSNLV